MSDDVVIKVEGLGKRYRIHHQGKGHSEGGLRHAISEKAHQFIKKMGMGRGKPSGDDESSYEDFWALQDVSFEIRRGEIAGVMGRNGAGKSTLLKILSRITEPTLGRVEIDGRVASLLEVGTGFHQELSGRENIYLNGAIMGMSRAEIKRRFDEIVAFAAVEKFLDTPVKRYSSGMYVRLAFAVAAHMEPEILVVDEVLAVGDAEFQAKCLGKMSEVANGGRTVLFVSHNLASLSRLCNRGIVLKNGRKEADGSLAVAIENYLRSEKTDQGRYDAARNKKPYQIMSIRMPSLAASGTHVSGQPMSIQVEVRADRPIRQGCLSIHITNYANASVLHFKAYDQGVFFGKDAGTTILDCTLPECWLNVGIYRMTLFLSDPPGGDHYEVLQGVCPFEVVVQHASTWFGWKPENCAYLLNEQWSGVTNAGEAGEQTIASRHQ